MLITNNIFKTCLTPTTVFIVHQFICHATFSIIIHIHSSSTINIIITTIIIIIIVVIITCKQLSTNPATFLHLFHRCWHCIRSACTWRSSECCSHLLWYTNLTSLVARICKNDTNNSPRIWKKRWWMKTNNKYDQMRWCDWKSLLTPPGTKSDNIHCVNLLCIVFTVHCHHCQSWVLL